MNKEKQLKNIVLNIIGFVSHFFWLLIITLVILLIVTGQAKGLNWFRIFFMFFVFFSIQKICKKLTEDTK